MKLVSSWSRWSVEQFLESENWRGEMKKNDLEMSPPVLAIRDFLQLSWSVISVENFLKSSNWDGKIKPREDLPLIPEVKGIVLGSSWSSLTVAAFLQQENWQGIYKQPSPQVLQPPPEIKEVAIAKSLALSWSTLRVGQFFEACNWRGRPQQTQKVPQESAQIDFNLSVTNFLESVIWEGKPEIGSLPKFASESELIAFPVSGQEATVDDLFDLF